MKAADAAEEGPAAADGSSRPAVTAIAAPHALTSRERRTPAGPAGRTSGAAAGDVERLREMREVREESGRNGRSFRAGRAAGGALARWSGVGTGIDGSAPITGS
ncbi:hypothetical protein GCM10018772_21910 [Streptomyces fumanus]|uniref:Uncharacterized protein n=1 Tax=Streptomyces fumanus TaxID=67302 RepID=A0A919ADV6_9ACTN|nr:hypothetical protein GCM10018772_21910 [Streptomyces fumanus]